MANDTGSKTYCITLEQLKALTNIIGDLDAVKYTFLPSDNVPAKVEEGHRIIEAILGDDRPLVYGEPEK